MMVKQAPNLTSGGMGQGGNGGDFAAISLKAGTLTRASRSISSQLDRLIARRDPEQPIDVEAIVFFDFDGTCGRKGSTDDFGFKWAAEHTRPIIAASSLLTNSLFSPCTARTVPEALKIIGSCFTVPVDGNAIASSGISVAENGATLFLSALPDNEFDKLRACCDELEYRLVRRADLAVDIVVIANRKPSDFHEQIILPALIASSERPVFASSCIDPNGEDFENELKKLQQMAGHSSLEDAKASIERYATAYLKVANDPAGQRFVESMSSIAKNLGVTMHIDQAREGFPIITVEFESGLNKGSGIQAANRLYNSIGLRARSIAHIGDAMNDAPGFAAAIGLGGKAFLVDSAAMSSNLLSQIIGEAPGTIFLQGFYDSLAIEQALKQLSS